MEEPGLVGDLCSDLQRRALEEALLAEVEAPRAALFELLALAWAYLPDEPGDGFVRARPAAAERFSRLSSAFRLEVPPGLFRGCSMSVREGFELLERLRGMGVRPEGCGSFAPLFARGLFLSCGYIHLPRWGYHLELRLPSRQKAFLALTLLSRRGFGASLRRRRSRHCVEMRRQEDIAGFFALCEMPRTALLIEDTSVYRSVKELANQVVNCDQANIRRVVMSSERQLDTLRRLEELNLLEMLSPLERELARLREENPNASLEELGEMLSRPISKGAVHYHFRRMERLLSKFRERG